MISDHIHAFLIGLTLSLSAISFFIWAWVSGLFKDPEEAKMRAYEIETGEDPRVNNVAAKPETGEEGQNGGRD